jgi:hypothetical protein
MKIRQVQTVTCKVNTRVVNVEGSIMVFSRHKRYECQAFIHRVMIIGAL